MRTIPTALQAKLDSGVTTLCRCWIVTRRDGAKLGFTDHDADIALDGDLLAVMEALYREVTAKRELERSFEDMVKEIHHLIDQMDEGERRTYLAESLFLNTVKYENDKLEAYMKKLTKK